MKTEIKDEAPVLQEVSDWLVEQGLAGSSLENLFSGYCERLNQIGIPLWRGHIGMRTLHPIYGSQALTWLDDGSITRDEFLYSPSNTKDWMESPYYWMLNNDLNFAQWTIDRTSDQQPFPMFNKFAEQGGTDYVARIVGYGEDGILEGKTGLLSSYMTQRPEGFLQNEIAALDRLNRRLALSVKTLLNIEISKNLVDTYIGREAGHRVLSGEIHRGFHSVISAAIYFADLRNFTSLTDQLSRDQVIPMLDSYFECMVKPVIAGGGDVLKFTGDGILATFNLIKGDAAEICDRAMNAAIESLRLMNDLNMKRRQDNAVITTFDIVLHKGNVSYGNVGALDRLDFTAIGPAVNEAARIEQLCDDLNCNLLVSDRFAHAVKSTQALCSLGVHAFRGLRRSYELYTVQNIS